MLPVDVLISHLPPVIVFGTLTLPTLVSVINTFSVSNVPETLPVLVSTKISLASEPSKITLPVLLLMWNSPVAITFVKIISPVLPSVVKFLHLTSVKSFLPVETSVLGILFVNLALKFNFLSAAISFLSWLSFFAEYW